MARRWLQETADACGNGQVDKKKKAVTEQRVGRLEKFLERLHAPVREDGPDVLQLLAVASFRCSLHLCCHHLAARYVAASNTYACMFIRR